MARPEREINVECGKRLKMLLKETGTTQKELSNKIYLSQQTISQIINGHATLTPETAKLIIGEFPEYNIYWLLGELPVEIRNAADIRKASAALISGQINRRQSYMINSLDFFGYDCSIASESVTITNRETEMVACISYPEAEEYCNELIHLTRAFIEYHFEKELKKEAAK